MAAILKNRANALAYAKLIDALVRGAHTTWSLCQLSNLHYNTVRKFIRAAQGPQHRTVRVASWTRDRMGRWVIPQFSFGTGPDEPRPPAMTSTERSRARRSRKLTSIFALSQFAERTKQRRKKREAVPST